MGRIGLYGIYRRLRQWTIGALVDYMGIIVDCGQWTIGAVVDYMGIAAMYDMSQIVQWMDYTGFGYHNWTIRDFLLDYNGRTFGLYGPHMNGLEEPKNLEKINKNETLNEN